MRRFAVRAIRFYQRYLTRYTPNCRYYPSCSEYGAISIGRFGLFWGGLLVAHRLMRCNPWGGHGLDPVPPRRDGEGDPEWLFRR